SDKISSPLAIPLEPDCGLCWGSYNYRAKGTANKTVAFEDEGKYPRSPKAMSTQAEIIVKEGARALGHYYLDPGEYVIGRDMSCDILLDCAGISPRHAHLTITNDHLVVRDLDSTNGTFIGDNI